MDSRDILKELGEIRGSLIDDADPEKETDSAGRRSSRPARRWIVRGIGAAAAAALVILAVCLSDGKPQVTDPAGTSGSETLTNEEAKQQVPDSNMQGEVKQSISNDDPLEIIKQQLPKGNMHGEAELAWFSERELLMRADLIVRGKAEAAETYQQPLKGPMEGYFQTFVILTISVQDVLRGDGAQPGETIRLAVSDLSGYDSALKQAAPGAEGIFLMHETEPWAEALKERAAFIAGDGVRFAVWQKNDSLVYERAAFTGLQTDWTLEQAADYFRGVIGDEDPSMPEDFAVYYEIRSFGENADYDTCRIYDSAAGTWHHEFYRFVSPQEAERVIEDLSFEPLPETLRDVYRSYLKLKDLPETHEEAAEGRELTELVLRFTADGKVHEYRYTSPYLQYMGSMREPLATMNAVLFEITQLTTMDRAFVQALDDNTVKHKDLDAKIVSFESFREMEDYADVIVRVTREEQETPVIVRSGENIVSGFTFSQVRIEKIHKDKTGRLQAGASIRVLENEFYDEQSKTVYHVAGYSMMKEGAPYLLFLKRNTYSDGEDYYTAAGVHFGTVSLSADGRTARGYDETVFRPFWDEAKKKYAAD